MKKSRAVTLMGRKNKRTSAEVDGANPQRRSGREEERRGGENRNLPTASSADLHHSPFFHAVSLFVYLISFHPPCFITLSLTPPLLLLSSSPSAPPQPGFLSFLQSRLFFVELSICFPSYFKPRRPFPSLFVPPFIRRALNSLY